MCLRNSEISNRKRIGAILNFFIKMLTPTSPTLCLVAVKNYFFLSNTGCKVTSSGFIKW